MAENALQVFTNEQFGEVRTLIEGGNILFCATDIARALGYSNPHDATARHCKGVVKREGVSETVNQHGVVTSQVNEMSFIPEGDVYRLIVRSKLPLAEKFEKWVFEEVLPDIRNHGIYATDVVIDKMLSDPNTMIVLLTKYKEEKEKRQALEAEIQIQKPLVDFAIHVSDTADLLTMSQMAKIAHDEKINIGRNKLFDWLRDRGYLRPNNEPYQEFIDRGYFKVKETRKDTMYGPQFYTQTFVTGRGQIYFIEKLRSEFGTVA